MALMVFFDDEPDYFRESKKTKKYIRVENDYVGYLEVSTDYEYWVKDVPLATDLGACIEFVLRMMQPGGCFHYLGEEYPDSTMILEVITAKQMESRSTQKKIYSISFKKWNTLWKQGLIAEDPELYRIAQMEKDQAFDAEIRRLDAELDALK